MSVDKSKIPSKVFIVPYRNRKEQLFFFCKYMLFLLENDLDNCEIYFSHQNDNKPFCRGGTKNIGFLAIKSKYPNDYKNINFIFNDVDTIPFNKIFTYETDIGKVAHYYGFTNTLGGIVVIKGCDFEAVNGYPNLWGWGREDFIFQTRCVDYGLIIDRSVFYNIGSPEILQLFDGVARTINPEEIIRTGKYADDQSDGLVTIGNLYYTIDKTSKSKNDEGFVIENKCINIINILNFTTKYNYNENSFKQYDLRNSEKELLNKKNKKVVNFVEDNKSWTEFAYKPTTEEKISQQRTVLYQRNLPQYQPLIQSIPQIQPNSSHPQYYLPRNPNLITQQNIMKNQTQAQIQSQIKTHLEKTQYPNRLRPRAAKSANVGLGGVF